MKNKTILINPSAISVLASETCNTGKTAVKIITMPATAGATEGDFIVLKDTSGVSWGVCLDKNGGGVANAGPIYTAINTASNMAIIDISGLTTAIQIATAAVTALNLLAGFTTMLTLVDVGDGTITMTTTVRNAILSPVPLNATEAGAGSITQTNSVTGVPSAFNVTANTIALTSTTFVTGTEVAVSIASNTLPAPIVAGTYYAIKVSTSVIKLAWSYAQAVAGIAIDITDQGTADKVVTIKGTGQKSTAIDISGVITLSIQVNINYSLITSDAVGSIALETSNDNVRWAAVASSSLAFTRATDCLIWDLVLNSNYIRTSVNITSGGNSTLFDTIVACKILPGY